MSMDSPKRLMAPTRRPSWTYQALIEPNRVGVCMEDLELNALQIWLLTGPLVEPLNQPGAVPLPPASFSKLMPRLAQ